ncbi:MAG: nucleotidyltransferase family protein [Casimicrobiaceae bacterium]
MPAVAPAAVPPSTRLVEAILDPATLTGLELPAWEPILACARRNAVLAYLAHRATLANVIDDLPHAPRVALRSAQTAAARLAQLARFELDRVRRALQPPGIPLIALKGAAYLLRGMPHASTRIMSDVDVMVPRARIDEAERALADGGWQGTKLDPYDQTYYRRWSHEIPPLQHPGRLLAVDVHHTIVPPVSRLKPDPAAFWADAQHSAIDGIALLSPVDSLLHAAVHLFFDSDFDGRFRDLVDVHEMFSAFGAAPGFWTALVERARAQGLTRPLYYACATSAAVLRTAIPADVVQALREHRPPRPVDAWMRRTLTTLLAPADARRWPPPHRGLVWLMYVRSHWLRMPPHLLLPHLLRKSVRRGPAL